MDVYVGPFHVTHKILCRAPFDERYTGTALVVTEENVKDGTSTDDLKKILVGRTVGQVLGNDRPLFSSGILLPFWSLQNTALVISVGL